MSVGRPAPVWVDGVARPDFGAGFMQRLCSDCAASWIGPPDEGCAYCAQALELQLEEQRRRLLWPDWAEQQGPRYDELDPVSRAVWDRTRGITRGEASQQAWLGRLADAVRAGIITETNVRSAIARTERRPR